MRWGKTRCHERRENEGNSERERGRDRQMLAEVEFIGR